MSLQKTGVYFIDGCSPRGELVGVISYLHELTDHDAEFSRFYTIKSGQWSHFEIYDEVRSVVFTMQPEKSWWLLGKRGKVHRITPNGRSQEQIEDAGTGSEKHGYLDRLAVVDGCLYACGYQRQLYRRVNDAWMRFDGDIRCDALEFGIGFTSMAGTSSEDMYAVGRRGEIWHYDGRQWQSDESPTVAQLNDVYCVRPDLVYIVGKDGTLLCGRFGHWETIDTTNFSHTFWSIASFKSELYIASSYGLVTLRDDRLEIIETGFSKPTQGYRLTANEDTLWSIGTNEILCFDGSSWTNHPCPDNP